MCPGGSRNNSERFFLEMGDNLFSIGFVHMISVDKAN